MLFRVIELESGTITIDGVDISKIGLADLRSRLCVVPQDSQLYIGTIRENVDPTRTSTDQEIWKALEQARLKEHVQSMEGGLDANVEEGGSNLSAGQRQLMCLARALLRKGAVLVLDEATSSIDGETDKLVQQIIRSEFDQMSILTVAHRLDTILDSDAILVMDAGKVAEFAPPQDLLADKSSMFSALAKQAGIRDAASGTATPAHKDGTATPR